MITFAYSRSERAEILNALRAVSLYYSQQFPIAYVRAIILQDTVAACLRGLTWARDGKLIYAESPRKGRAFRGRRLRCTPTRPSPRGT